MERLEKAAEAELDVLIAFPEFSVPDLFGILGASHATVKALVVAGFTPDEYTGKVLRGEEEPATEDFRRLRDAVRAYWVLPDSDWQGEWLKEQAGIQCGPGWAGVNFEQFHPVKVKHDKDHPRVLCSGDPRERKGGDTVRAALDLVQAAKPAVVVDSYWKRGIAQDKLAEWLCMGDVFVDGHRRAGWCNPVAEAMACGVAVVCTDIPATRMIAEDEVTALVVPVDDSLAMARAILRLLDEPLLRARLSCEARRQIAAWDYDIIAARLEAALEDKLDAVSSARSENGRLITDHAAETGVRGGLCATSELAADDANALAGGVDRAEGQDLSERSL